MSYVAVGTFFKEFDSGRITSRISCRGIDSVDRDESVLTACAVPFLFDSELNSHTRCFVKLRSVTLRAVVFQ